MHSGTSIQRTYITKPLELRVGSDYLSNSKKHEKDPRYSEQISQSLGPSLNQGSTVVLKKFILIFAWSSRLDTI